MKNINIKEIIEEAQNIMQTLHWEAIQMTGNLAKYPHKKRDIDERIKQLEENFEALDGNYANLLENQKPSNLPVDWEEQLAKIKELETRLTEEEKSQLQQQISNLQQKLTSLKTTLPDLFNKEGKVNEELLVLLTNILAGIKDLENGREKSVKITVGENYFYELVSSLEKEENNKLKERFKLLEKKTENNQLVDQKTIANLQEQTSEQEEKINELKRQLQISQREDELNEKLQGIQRKLSEKESANQVQTSVIQSENDRLKEKLEETKVKVLEKESAIERNRKITIGLTQDNEKLRGEITKLKELTLLQKSKAQDVNYQEAQVVVLPFNDK